MKVRNQMIIFGAAMLATPAAFAQTAQTAPAAPAAPTQPAAPAAGATTVSDTEVSQFATAALAINKIQNDAAVPAADKTTQFIAAINAAGLQPARFNEIASAMQSDKALNDRIQKAGAALGAPPAQ